LLPSDFDYDSEAAAIAERFLGNVGCGVAEADALRLEGGTAEMLRSWEQSRRFRRALKDARERGEENRRYDETMAARRSQDLFGIPARGGMDLAAETYDLQNPPRGGMGGWLRWLKQAFLAQPAEESATTPGQRFIPEADMTPQDWQAYQLQEAGRRQPQQSRSIFSQKPNPDSSPTPE
jgi:hypothetical protein